MNKCRYVVREHEVEAYHPANHTGTVNRRLISPETVGAKHLEVLLGVVERGSGALPHAHPGIEQVCYMLAGRARIEVGEGDDREVAEIGPGDCCFFPADTMHVFTVISEETVRVLITYSPQYGEDPTKVRR